jgi:hypothetical protein
LWSFIEALAIGLAPVFAVIPVLMLIVNGDVLGPWWIPLLMLYIMLFYVGEIFLIGHKYRNEVHMQVGHEAFYEIFPKERRRALHAYQFSRILLPKLLRKDRTVKLDHLQEGFHRVLPAGHDQSFPP